MPFITYESLMPGLWDALWPMLAWFVPLMVVLVAGRAYLEDRASARKKAALPPPLPLETKMIRLAEITSEAALLNAEVQTEIIIAQNETVRLKADAEESERLAALSAEQSRAVESMVNRQMSAALGRSGKADRRTQLVYNVTFFVAGAVLTLFVPPLWK
jgi:hypothetical protein